MGNLTICMSTIRQVLRMHARNRSMQSIMDMTGVSRNTLRKYLKKFKESGVSMDSLTNMGDKELSDMFMDVAKPEPNTKVQILTALMPKIERELTRPGVTLERLWKEYNAEHPDGFKITQYRRYFRKWKQQNSPTMHIEHKAGDKLYVDFTGEKMEYVDSASGVVQPVDVFVSFPVAHQLTRRSCTQSKEGRLHQCLP